MATIQNQNQQSEQEGQQQLTSGASVSGTSAIPGQSAPGRQGSGRFMNIRKYIEANKGAGERLTGQIGGQVGREAEAARGAIGGAQSQAESIRQSIEGEKARLANASNYVNMLRQQGGAEQLASQNLEDFSRLRQGQSAIPELSQQAKQVEQAYGQNISQIQNLADLSRTEPGRFQLLRKTFGGASAPNYNLGQRRLDQLFLQSGQNEGFSNLNKQLQSQVEQERQKAAQVQQGLSSQIGGAQEAISQASSDIQSALGSFGASGQGELGSLYGQLSQEAVNRSIKQGDLVKGLQNALGTGVISQEQAQMLGIPTSLQRSDVKDLSGVSGKLGSGSLNAINLVDQSGNVDLSKYLSRDQLQQFAQNINPADTNITMADVISGQQQSRLDALRQLAGLAPTEINLGEKSGGQVFGKQGIGPGVGAVFDPSQLINQLQTIYQQQNPLANPISTTDIINANKETAKQIAIRDMLGNIGTV